MTDGAELDRTLLARMQALGHIRLAHGVVGKISVVAGIALLVLGGVSWRAGPDLLLLLAGMVLITFFVYLASVLWFAHRHPEQALLEGAEIIQYRAQELAARGLQGPSPSTPPTQPLPPDRAGVE